MNRLKIYKVYLELFGKIDVKFEEKKTNEIIKTKADVHRMFMTMKQLSID